MSSILSMKNDLAFLIKNELNLYEAQSTFNPNMPLRGLSYFSRLYQGYVEFWKLDVYSSGRIILPAPRYIVFYNGRKDLEDQVELRLSDSFETADGLALEEAVDRAVDVCLENGILKELLSVHRAEVKHVILTEYNEELHLKNTFEEGREEGLKEGQISFARLYALECLENNVSEMVILETLCTRYGLKRESAEACLKAAKT